MRQEGETYKGLNSGYFWAKSLKSGLCLAYGFLGCIALCSCSRSSIAYRSQLSQFNSIVVVALCASTFVFDYVNLDHVVIEICRSIKYQAFIVFRHSLYSSSSILYIDTLLKTPTHHTNVRRYPQ